LGLAGLELRLETAGGGSAPAMERFSRSSVSPSPSACGEVNVTK
jgi:hypothetical protein